LNRVRYQGERVVVERRGKGVAALVPVEDLELLQALEDRIDLAAARKALREPGRIPWEKVKQDLGLQSVAYAVVLKPAAVRDLRKLPEDARRRVAARLDTLAAIRGPWGGGAPGGIRPVPCRVGDYRIIYQVEHKGLVVLVARIGHRRAVYRQKGARAIRD
jgi:mRNA interferase RelE/StbE